MSKHIPIMILNDQGGSVMDVSYKVAATLRAQDHGHPPVMCFQQNQREEVRNMGEQAGALTAEPGTHNNNYLCYCIEGNVVDRVSAKNGKGWCEDVSPTLNTQDRHAVCFQLCGDRDDPSVSFSDRAFCIPANPMSDRGQAVCYEK